MKGNFRKKYDFSIIVTAEDLKALLDTITDVFKYVRYEIETSDGAKYTTNELKDILEYTNPDTRKIELLRIRGNLNEGESFFSPNICISLFDTSKFDKSIIFDLNEMEEKEIIYYTTIIDEFARRIKAPYWWIFKDWFYWICGIILYFSFGFIYLSNTDITNTINKVYSILLLQGVSAVCMAFSMYALSKVVSFFFPESCFAFGEQVKFKIKKEKRRSIIFITLLLALIIGIISNIISYYIVSK